MKINNYIGKFFLQLFGVAILGTLFSCASYNLSSSSYIKGRTVAVDMFMTKTDLINAVKKNAEDENMLIDLEQSLKLSSQDQISLLVSADGSIKSFSKNNKKDVVLYLMYVDYLPKLLEAHKVLVFDKVNHKIDKQYYYKRCDGKIYFYLSNHQLFYESIESIIE